MTTSGLLRWLLSIVAPPPRYTVASWAEAFREMARGSTAEPGKYRLSRMPYQQEPQEALTDPTVSEVILLWARQLGKTTILENLCGYIMDVDPGNIFVKYPTQMKAADFSRKKLTPMIKETPRLRRKIQPARSRDSGNTIFSKLFPGGSISMVGANSASALRQLSCRVVIQDEIDSDAPNSEGDPVPQADATASNFHDAILVKASTPTQEPEDDGRGGQTGSRIQILFNESDQRFWNVACPRCNHWQILKWPQVKWTWKMPDGTTFSDPEKAVYVCEGCQAELSDFDRVRMVMHGRWVAKNPKSRRRGYHLSGLYRVMGKKRAYKSYLHEFVENFLKAKREGSIDVWQNTFLAECSSHKWTRLDIDPLLERRETYGPELPVKVLVLTAQVDVQGDRLECMVKGWGLGFESWGIRHDVLLGDPHKPEVWRKLHEWIAQEVTHPILGKLHLPIVLIDSGGQSNDAGFADPVYRFVRPRQPNEIGPGVYATKGSSRLDGALVTNRRPKKGICLKLIGTSLAKTTVHARLRIEEAGPRFMHYPIGAGFDEEYFEQLGAEIPKIVKKKGYNFTEWHKIRSRNEALDLEVLALAAVEILNPDLKAIAAKVRAKGGQLEEQKAVPSDGRPPPRTAQPRGLGRRHFRLVRPQFKKKWLA